MHTFKSVIKLTVATDIAPPELMLPKRLLTPMLLVRLERRQRVPMKGAATCQRSSVGWELRQGFNVGKKEAINQRAVLAMADAMSSVAALSFGVSASVMRPTSPYLNAPPLAHSTTSPMPCFLVVATRRAAVRNSFRS